MSLFPYFLLCNTVFQKHVWVVKNCNFCYLKHKRPFGKTFFCTFLATIYRAVDHAMVKFLVIFFNLSVFLGQCANCAMHLLLDLTCLSNSSIDSSSNSIFSALEDYFSLLAHIQNHKRPRHRVGPIFFYG